MLTLSAPRSPRTALLGAVVALIAAIAVAVPANAATMIESPSDSADAQSLNFAYSPTATGLNFTQPGDTSFHYVVRKAG